MAPDTFFAYCGVYADTEAALADYDVHALHTEIGLIDAYDAADRCLVNAVATAASSD